MPTGIENYAIISMKFAYKKNTIFTQAELVSQRIDPRISLKIEEYVKEGITNVREMKRLLKLTVADLFGKKDLPLPNNRRFYPRIQIIRSHMTKAKQKIRYKKLGLLLHVFFV